jgi:DNA-directed RNA polymerase subunit RPC12/RpoP
MTAELIKKLIGPTKRAIKDSKMKPSDIDKVILVGGSTRTPSVQKAVKDMLRKDPDKGVNPDECVAVGAAIQAGVLTGEVKDVLLLDVIPLSLGIETLGGVCSKFIPRNTTIPTSRTQIFSTAEDNQSSVEVHVLQGEREMAADNKTLGRFHLIGIPPAPRGVPQVEVCFDVDANGILSVSAKDLATGKEQKITVTASAGLAKGDIDSMIEESKKFAKKDRRKKKIAELRNKADSLIYSTEKAIEELGPKLDKGQRRKTEKAVAVLKESLKGDDPRKIKADVERLNDFSQELFTTMYSEAALRYDDEEEAMPPSRRMRDEDVMAPPPPDAGTIDVEYSEKRKKKKEKEKAAGKPPKKPAEEKATTIRCPKCKGKIKVTTDKRPLKIECPACGTKGTLKDDKKKPPKEVKAEKEEKPPKKVKKEEKPPKKEAREEEPEEMPPKKVKKEEKPPKKEEKKKAATPLKIPCKCGGEIVVETDERPAKIECPKCGRKGTLK